MRVIYITERYRVLVERLLWFECGACPRRSVPVRLLCLPAIMEPPDMDLSCSVSWKLLQLTRLDLAIDIISGLAAALLSDHLPEQLECFQSSPWASQLKSYYLLSHSLFQGWDWLTEIYLAGYEAQPT